MVAPSSVPSAAHGSWPDARRLDTGQWRDHSLDRRRGDCALPAEAGRGARDDIPRL